MNIAGSTALVTGANRGLGRQLAAQLLTRGATVYAGARNPDTVDLPGAKVVSIDITDPASVAAAAEVAGDVTVLINNAGSSTGSAVLGGDLEDLRLEMKEFQSLQRKVMVQGEEDTDNRVPYFLRRALETLTEFGRGLNRIRAMEEFKRAAPFLTAIDAKYIAAADKFIQQMYASGIIIP